MPSVPTTSLDLTAPEFVADPYPAFAEERARHGFARHLPSGTWLAFSHAAAGAVLRNRALGRVWHDREPAAALEPFNLLHRNQMMENEPPEHTRLRRPVAAAFNRGHVERLRPRVRSLAAELLDAAGDRFDVIEAYAEPLPVMVIAELLGVARERVADLRVWSQAIVRMYEVDPTAEVVAAAVAAAEDFDALVRDLVAERRQRPADDLTSDLAATGLSDDEVVASVVLLLNAGHEASVNVFGNGLVGMLARDLTPGEDVASAVEEMLRFDSALQLFERTATSDTEIAGVPVRKGERVAALLGSANRDPAVFDAPADFRTDRDPNPHLAFGAGVHFCLGSPLARMEMVESVTALFDRYPRLALDGVPESRGTFVLRGHRAVQVSSGA
ncbi:MAG: cytochrome P450 [Nocardioidaceae bacterium]|nr:cytochrome P450 [Nocardioidaceae bacterium]MCL2614551.1 cytochrome P450 [Nocardioidaceae bacterium]